MNATARPIVWIPGVFHGFPPRITFNKLLVRPTIECTCKGSFIGQDRRSIISGTLLLSFFLKGFLNVLLRVLLLVKTEDPSSVVLFFCPFFLKDYFLFNINFRSFIILLMLSPVVAEGSSSVTPSLSIITEDPR